MIHRLPCIAVLVLQQEGGSEQRLTIGILLRDGDRAGAAVILGSVLNLRIMFLHGPDARVVLIQQIALRGLHLLPHIGDAEYQILKGDSTVIAGGQGAFRTV